MKRVMAIAVCLCAAGAAWWWLHQDAPVEQPAQPSVRVESTTGAVEHERGGVVGVAKVGLGLVVGDLVRTGGDGSAVLSSGASQIRLDDATTVRLLGAASDSIELELERGQVKARVGDLGPAVRVANAGRVVTTRGGESTTVVDGDQLVVESTGDKVRIEGVDGISQVVAGKRLLVSPAGIAVTDVSAEPLLDVAWPKVTKTAAVDVTGEADPGAVVRVVGGPSVRVGIDGSFRVVVEVAEGANTVELLVTDPLGRTRTVVGTIQRAGRAPKVKVSARYE